ncbi:hypothetical protein DLD99_14415 [Pseudomonas kribbensis]|uniref:DUF4259 domain-containing protein n=1 Tax=Pseudomonas kribbensis TaxID=1628086 RepID=A0A345RQQ0_9PSED|nr:DUF4259 domain-containing protein [Pseudomonas kribbensis]AXI61616.1 hypothetical protein DLD99_14415 [Pseudomonas kribbensis]
MLKDELSMGTWSIHAFGNDEAADFAIELSESSDLDLIQSALEDVIAADEYLEAPEADRGIAAAAVLALLNGQEIPGTLDEALSTWVKSQTTKPGSALLTKAQVVIERVLSENSELAELWIESEEYESWQDGLRLIKASLGR